MRLSEIYTSTQGEGPRVGVPTTFVRFAGCNLRCPGWACDTQHAIDPKLYRNEWLELGPEQIYERVMNEVARFGIKNVCLTGGEPFLQEHDRLMHLVNMLRLEGLNIEVFTNGTIEWPSRSLYRLSFIMDWKLDGSGEKVSDSDTVWQNAIRLGEDDAIKFTVTSKSDLSQAYSTYQAVKLHISPRVQVFCGPVWGKFEPAEVVQWILDHKLPWKLNLQVHKYIWNPDARRT